MGEGPAGPLPIWIAARFSLCLKLDGARGPMNDQQSSCLSEDLAIFGYHLEAFESQPPPPSQHLGLIDYGRHNPSVETMQPLSFLSPYGLASLLLGECLA
jgi:hypothetical protein